MTLVVLAVSVCADISANIAIKMPRIIFKLNFIFFERCRNLTKSILRFDASLFALLDCQRLSEKVSQWFHGEY